MNKWQISQGDGGRFTIDLLHQQELDIIRRTSKQTESWLKNIWKWLAVAYLVWTPGQIDELLRITRFPMDDLELPIKTIFETGSREAGRDLRLPPVPRNEAEIPIRATSQPGSAEIERYGHPASQGGGKQGPPAQRKVRLQALWYARTSSGLKMREWANGMRDDVRWQVVEALREGISAEELKDRLEVRWEKYGQNFALIATTEMNDAYNSGYLLSLPAGSYVTVPPINDDKVCEYCKRLLEGKVFEVLHHAPKNPTRFELETCVWPGKSNVGRKPKDYVPCITLHPGCRHKFVYLSGRPVQKGWVNHHTWSSKNGNIHMVSGYWRNEEKEFKLEGWSELGLPAWEEIMKKQTPGFFKRIKDVDELDRYLWSLQDVFKKDKDGWTMLPTKDGMYASLESSSEKRLGLYWHWVRDYSQKEADRRISVVRAAVETLYSPWEIWRQPVSKAGREGRVYLKGFHEVDEKGKIVSDKSIIVIVGMADNKPIIWTWFPASEYSKVDRARYGELLLKDY